jgi:hypothetical protein
MNRVIFHLHPFVASSPEAVPISSSRRSRSNRRGWSIAAVLCAVSVLASAVVLRAHEPGTTTVSASFDADGTYRVEIVTDALALAEKLEAAGGRLLPTGIGHAEVQSLLRHSDAAFRKKIALAFETSEVRPVILYNVAPPADAFSGPVATIALTGTVPPGAHHFTWSYGWTFTSYALEVRDAAAEKPSTRMLEGGQPSPALAVPAAPSRAARIGAAWRYARLGFGHVVPNGLDHMLFLLGLYLLSRRGGSLALLITAYAVAHSMALAASLFALVSVSSKIVSPLMALSIAYVAIDSLLLSELKSWRVVLVFAFGLVHGLHFAAGLTDLGLSRADLAAALLPFNLGLEAGQLAVVGAAFALIGWRFADHAWYRSRIVLPGSTLLACTAVYWTIERLSF